MFKRKIGLVALIVLVGLVFGGCITPDKNRAPTVARVSYPETAIVGDEVKFSVVSTDPNGDRIAYKLDFGNEQSEWSDLIASGVAKTFFHAYDNPGDYGVCGIASDEHRKNSGWSEKTYIKVTVPTYEVGPERLFFCVPEHADLMQVRLFAATADFARIKAAGVTMIHTYGTNFLPDSGKYFLDDAHAHGLKVLYCIKSLIHDKIKAGQPWDRENCRELVERFDDYPALYGWYILDEPDLGIDDPAHGVPLWLQKEISDAFRSWTNKPLVIATCGGPKGYHLVNFECWDLIIPDCYPFDGDDDCWGMKPLPYLDFAAGLTRKYIDEHNITVPFMFMMQADSSPATGEGRYGTRVPLGQIRGQFEAVYPHNLFKPGVAWYAWSGGDFDPNRHDEIYNEIKQFITELDGG